MNDQLHFGKEYISEKEIIRRVFAEYGRKGGLSRSPKKSAASRKTILVARSVSVLRKAGKLPPKESKNHAR